MDRSWAQPVSVGVVSAVIGVTSSFIRRSKLAGLTLTQIGEILRVRDAGQAPCAHVVAHLAQHLTDLDNQIAELTALRASVASFYQVAAEGDPAQCDAYQICSYL